MSAEGARERTLRELAAIPVSEPTSLGPLVRRVVMASMLEAMFDDVTPAVRALGDAFARLVDRGAVPFAQLGIVPALRRDFPGSPWRAFERSLTEVNARIRGLLEHGTNGMLAALRAIRNEDGTGLESGVLRDEIFTLLGAGYETTATSIAWAFETILLHPPVAAEIARGDDALLDASIRESLRLRPTLPTVRRVATARFDAGDVCVEAGGSVVLAIHLLHRAGLADGDRFEPSRQDRPFFAFGGGLRTCPGLSLALEHMRGVLAALLPSLALDRGKKRSRPIFRGATLAPARSIVVRRLGTCAWR
jgi:cytochrome P450